MWLVPLKNIKRITITNAFQEFLDETNLKPNKILVDKESEFYNRSMKSWFQDDHIEMYSTHNKATSVTAERSFRTFKNKTSISKNVYIDKVDDIVNKYNNQYHSTIKI